MNCYPQCSSNSGGSHHRYNPRASGAIGFFALLLFLAVGLILGAIFYETITPILSTVIVAAILILAVIIALWIFYARNRNN